MATTENDLGLYYSGAVSHEQYQDDSNKSLGGYRSSVFISNSSLNNIFDELGIYELNNGQSIFRCIFLKNNNTVDTINNLCLYITGKKDYETIKFGISIPSTNISAVQFLNSQDSMAYNITWYEAYTEESKINLGNIYHDQVIALWLNREIQSGITEREETGLLNFIFDWE